MRVDAPTIGSLCAGIGGFDLGFERAGFEICWQVETDPYCLKVLEKNFPHAQRFGDIRGCGSTNLPWVNGICAGFPCQPVSVAGKRLAQKDIRWLWPECARIIGEIRPDFALLENVPGLLNCGMGDVLGDLSAIGYDAEWEVISAADLGAPHLRKRVWIIAYPNRDGRRTRPEHLGREARQDSHRSSARTGLANASIKGLPQRRGEQSGQIRDGARRQEPERRRADVADSELPCSARFGEHGGEISTAAERLRAGARQRGEFVADAGGQGSPQPEQEAVFGARRGNQGRAVTQCDWWAVEPELGRVANGIPSRVDRLKGLGNAVVPQIPEMIANWVKETMYAG